MRASFSRKGALRFPRFLSTASQRHRTEGHRTEDAYGVTPNTRSAACSAVWMQSGMPTPW